VFSQQGKREPWREKLARIFGATAVSDRLDVAVLVIRPMVGDIFHANLHPDTGTHSTYKLAK